MSERDELADLLAKHEDCAFSASGVLVCTCGTAMQPNEAQWDLANLAGHQADTLLAAGYRRPRTVTTEAELEALPKGSVVLDSYGSAMKKDGHYWFDASSYDMPMTALYIYENDFLPATVLHEPEATK